MRRYRVYLLAVAFFLVTIYYVTSSGAFVFKRLGKHNRAAGFRGRPLQKDPFVASVRPVATAVVGDDDQILAEDPSGDFDERIEPQTSSTSIERKTSSASDRVQPTSISKPTSEAPPSFPLFVDEAEEGSGRYEVSGSDDNTRPRWRKPKVQYPLRVSEIIKLPSGTPQTIPKVQATFGSESVLERTDRMQKLNVVKESFQHAWNGYKKYGLPHDEVKPLSRDFADPFMGWGATLVDTLDTLWIMGLRQEFEDALVAVAKIDFKTSQRSEIPLFETVIRYLGGLLAAYDISDAKYPMLLEKAEELAEMLVGAFDTPNRMPITFYNWKPADTKNPHRASSRAVMSELGSLAVEMTRLAQITKKHEYYDAIARITNELEKWQAKTRLPGLWPLKVDASGCKKAEQSGTQTTDDNGSPADDDVAEFENELVEEKSLEESDVRAVKRDSTDLEDEDETDHAADQNSSPTKGKKPNDECTPQGLSSEKDFKTEVFGIGGQADSTYEYFPKMHTLLCGRNKQYEKMYLNAMTSIRENLLFRPMIKEKDRAILFAARQEFTPKAKEFKKREETVYEVTHLSCFIGGMVGLGAKLFGIDDDLELAMQLTEGCVWAYESMPIGVMAETASVVPCPSLEICAWNEIRWHEALDPRHEDRFKAVTAWNKNQKAIFETSKKQTLINNVTTEEGGLSTMKSTNIAKADDPEYDHSIEKRDGLSENPPSKTKPLPPMDETANFQKDRSSSQSPVDVEFSPKTALPHDKYVKARIEEERLPESYTKIFDRHYGLRPEAIESVFYMYRITGDKMWQDKGWRMFLAIQAATQTEVANAAVKDVTSVIGMLDDTMESFWLAETLKYFYLLFSEPDVISLDEWVLNTEAHPLKIEGR